MKISLTRKAKQLASSLLVALVICSILSLFVMYYLSLIEQQSFMNARSQTWNMAIAVSEAGIEDGLAQLNNAFPDLGVDGWAWDGSTCYYKTNALVDGNGYVSYIYMTNWSLPTIVSRAFVTPPAATYWQTTAMILFASQGQSGNTAPTQINRAVQVICKKTNPFSGALIARNGIDLSGNNVMTDSFDSSDPAKSTNGQYDPLKYKGDKGDIATDLSIVDSINSGNANIFGHAHTGPGSPNNAVQNGANGWIGSHVDYANGGKGIDPGWWVDDANFDFPTTTYPDTSSFLTPTNGWVTNITSVIVTNTSPVVVTVPPQPGTYTTVTTNKIGGVTYYNVNLINTSNPYTTNTVSTGTYYDHILWGSAGVTNSYVASDLSGSTYVTGPNVVLALPSGLNQGSGDSFAIGVGANVTIYNGGTSCNIGGNGFVNNGGYAGDLLIFCAPTVTTLNYSGNAAFKGVICAPSADVQLGGSGNSTAIDFSGCFLANSIKMNGHFNFHYDEALSKLPGFGRFLILCWNEIK
jgi:hypothetical protein